MERHIKTKVHEAAVELEKANPELDVTNNPGPSQSRVDVITQKSSRDAYIKLIRTAYELALNSTMSLNHFSTLVKIQRLNGIRLIEGMDIFQLKNYIFFLNICFS